MRNPIDIVFRAITKPFQDGMKAASDSAKKMGDETKNAGRQASDGVNAAGQTTKKATSGMVTAWGDVKKAVTDFAKAQAGQLLGGLAVYDIVKKAITTLFNNIKQGMTDAVNKAADLQKMQVLVEAAGDSWAEMKPKIDKTFESIKAVTGFTGGELRSAFSRMTILTGDAKVANEQMALAADMASSGLFDLESASQALGMAMEGNVGRLGRLLPELRNMDSELGANASRAEKAEWILGKLENRFGGLSIEIDNDKEKIEQLSRAWKELRVNSVEPFLPIIPTLTKDIQALNVALKDGQGPAAGFFKVLKDGFLDFAKDKDYSIFDKLTTLATQGIRPILARGGGMSESARNDQRIITRNKELKDLLARQESGEKLGEKQLSRIKHLSVLHDEQLKLIDALTAGKISPDEYEKYKTQIAASQPLRGKILKTIGAEKVEGQYTRSYLDKMDKLDSENAKKSRDRRLKDLNETAKQLNLTDKEIVEKRLEIYSNYYEQLKSIVGTKHPMTEAAAKDLILARKESERVGAPEKKTLTEDQKIANYLKAEEVKTQDEINNALAEGNDALEIQKKHLLEQIEHLKNNKAAYEELVRLKTDVIKIDREIAKNNEEAEKKQEEIWKTSDKDDRKRGEEELKRHAETIKNLQAESELRSKERILNSRATGINALRIEQDEAKKLLEVLKQMWGTDEQIREVEDKLKQIAWDIHDAKKATLEKQKELFAKVVGGATQGVLDATVGNEAEVKKRLSDIEDDYTATIVDIQNQVRLAQLTGEEYDPLGAIADAKKRRIEAKRANKLPVTIAEEHDYATTAIQSKIAEKQKQQAQELRSSVSDAFYQGMTEGAQKGLAGFLDMLKNKIKRQLADSMADAILGTGKNGAGGGFNIMSLLGMGGGTGKQVPTATATGAGAFATGWSSMASQAAAMSSGGGAAAGGGAGGGILSLLGVGGAGGAMAGIMPWLGAAMLISGFTKHKSVAQSGVQPIFDTKPTIRGTDTGSLFGSDIFQRASFSTRNKGNALLASTMDARMEKQSIVHIIPSKEFDGITENKLVKIVKKNSLSGIPKRTNFEHY